VFDCFCHDILSALALLFCVFIELYVVVCLFGVCSVSVSASLLLLSLLCFFDLILLVVFVFMLLLPFVMVS
jgi:hypothetical protein